MKRFSNVLLVVNTNQIGFSALKQAVSIAKKNGASLTVASVLEKQRNSTDCPSISRWSRSRGCL